MTTPKFEHSEIQEMLENFKSKDWDFMLQSQKKLYAHSPQIISQLLEEVKELRKGIISPYETAHLEIAKVQIQILKEALTNYADEGKWVYDEEYQEKCVFLEDVHGYEIAKEALAKLNQVKGEG